MGNLENMLQRPARRLAEAAGARTDRALADNPAKAAVAALGRDALSLTAKKVPLPASVKAFVQMAEVAKKAGQGPVVQESYEAAAKAARSAAEGLEVVRLARAAGRPDAELDALLQVTLRRAGSPKEAAMIASAGGQLKVGRYLPALGDDMVSTGTTISLGFKELAAPCFDDFAKNATTAAHGRDLVAGLDQAVKSAGKPLRAASPLTQELKGVTPVVRNLLQACERADAQGLQAMSDSGYVAALRLSKTPADQLAVARLALKNGNRTSWEAYGAAMTSSQGAQARFALLPEALSHANTDALIKACEEVASKPGEFVTVGMAWLADNEPQRARAAFQQAARQTGSTTEALALFATLVKAAKDPKVGSWIPGEAFEWALHAATTQAKTPAEALKVAKLASDKGYAYQAQQAVERASALTK